MLEGFYSDIFIPYSVYYIREKKVFIHQIWGLKSSSIRILLWITNHTIFMLHWIRRFSEVHILGIMKKTTQVCSLILLFLHFANQTHSVDPQTMLFKRYTEATATTDFLSELVVFDAISRIHCASACTVAMNQNNCTAHHMDMQTMACTCGIKMVYQERDTGSTLPLHISVACPSAVQGNQFNILLQVKQVKKKPPLSTSPQYRLSPIVVHLQWQTRIQRHGPVAIGWRQSSSQKMLLMGTQSTLVFHQQLGCRTNGSW